MTVRVGRWRYLGGAAAVVLAACGGRAPTQPSPVAASAPTTFFVVGRVTEPVGVPVFAATVTVVAGVGVGNSARTNMQGEYGLPGASGPVTLTFAADGYSTMQREITIERNERLDVELLPLAPSVNIQGAWHVTFEASPDCSNLPQVARTRRYGASVLQQGAAVVVQFSDAKLSGPTKFEGKVRGDTMSLPVGDWDNGGMVEKVEDALYLMLWGTLSATASGAGLSGAFDGTIYLGDTAETVTREHCDSKTHRVTFARR